MHLPMVVKHPRFSREVVFVGFSPSPFLFKFMAKKTMDPTSVITLRSPNENSFFRFTPRVSSDLCWSDWR